MNTVQWSVKSEVGPLYVVASEKGLRGIFRKKLAAPMAPSLGQPRPEIQMLKQAVEQLQEYLSGERQKFDLPLDIQGTDFQMKVWRALRKVPYGKTCSYKDVAKKINQDKAVRAVGTANGKNPVCIVIPCHRVIAADGSLGGYSGGLDMKTYLLQLEQRTSG
ncbi:MAG: methylated-DNA--[protein]-cysteine S-methyltransferase [Bdellovibrio sp. CG10_big_fil_rev_8_21_14_0_10_47_8]|nr:MAG: methylated-DNA--[protein]-cysteine S-methyltransferase [Bdellovibrio sp. CG10_big_fil_rev_8_21_14_0_10_47_8]